MCLVIFHINNLDLIDIFLSFFPLTLSLVRATMSSISSTPSSGSSISSNLLNPFADVYTTAQTTALMRGFQSPWSSTTMRTVGPHGEAIGLDIYAHYFLPSSVRDELRNLVDATKRNRIRLSYKQSTRNLVSGIWSRTRAIDTAVIQAVEKGAQQVVILGAGYDSRCYRYRQLFDKHDIKRYELDLPTIQQDKKTLVNSIEKELGEEIGSAQVHYLPVDLSKPKDDVEKQMIELKYDKKLKTVFVWEGVTAYLTREDVIDTLKFITRMSASGSTAIVTFVTSETHRDLSQEERDKIKEGLAKKNEPHKFHPPMDDVKNVLFNENGFTIEEFLSTDILTEKYLNEDEKPGWAGAVVVVAKTN